MIRPVAAIIPLPGPARHLPGGATLVPLGEITCLERIIGLLQQCGLAQILVVGAAADHAALDLAAGVGATALARAGRHGLAALTRAGLGAVDPTMRAVCVLPGNVPLVRPSTVRRLLDAYCDGGAALLRPACCGRPGWPALVDAARIADMLAAPVGGNLERLFAPLATEAVVLDVADEHTRLRLSSPADLARIQASLTAYDLPSAREITVLLRRLYPASPGRLAHVRSVARIANVLAEALNAARAAHAAHEVGEEPHLDLNLVRAAALLHDLAKHHRHHEVEGGRILRELGFRSIARIVAAHRDLTPPEGCLTEREIVFLADKLVARHVPVAIRARFQEKLDQWAGHPDIQADIRQRLDNALAVAEHFESEAGRGLEEVLATAGIRLATSVPPHARTRCLGHERAGDGLRRPGAPPPDPARGT